MSTTEQALSVIESLQSGQLAMFWASGNAEAADEINISDPNRQALLAVGNTIQFQVNNNSIEVNGSPLSTLNDVFRPVNSEIQTMLQNNIFGQQTFKDQITKAPENLLKFRQEHKSLISKHYKKSIPIMLAAIERQRKELERSGDRKKVALVVEALNNLRRIQQSLLVYKKYAHLL